MNVKHVSISRFRGIRHLDWAVSGTTVCLIGPGDSTKSTVLDAIELALTPRWNVTLTDSDFYMGMCDEPLEIVVTLGELPNQLLSDDKFGLHLRGWSQESGLHDEPQDSDELVISIRFRADKSLEPAWTVVTDRTPDGCPISSRDREKFGVVRLTSYIDKQLSWSRGSALSRFTGDTDSIGSILAEAGRSARDIIENASIPRLNEAANRAQAAAAEFGLKPRDSYRPALDAAVSSEGIGAISLHDGSVPVRQAGLGSRRLLALALQRSAIRDGAVVLIDEVEHGLEPHRLRHLIRVLRPATYLRIDADHGHATTRSGQVFMTTHSSVAVVEAAAAEIYVVRSVAGTTSISQVPDGLQATIRSSPEALLGEKVIVCEGKTEYGLCRAFDAFWATQHDGKSLAYLGVVPVVGESSGSNAPKVAMDLAALGYEVAFLGDSDVPIAPSEAELNAAGIRVIQWSDGRSVEERISLDLPWHAIQELANKAIDFKGQQSVRDALVSRLTKGAPPGGLDLSQWLDGSLTEDDIRTAFGFAAKKGGWFKRIDLGEELGRFVVTHLPEMSDTDTSDKIGELSEWAYGA